MDIPNDRSKPMHLSDCISTVVLERCRLSAQMHYCPEIIESMKMEEWHDTYTETLVMRIMLDLWGEKKETEMDAIVEVPRSWWQFFKQRVFPAWLLRRSPMRTRPYMVRVRVEEMYLYPKLHIDGTDKRIYFRQLAQILKCEGKEEGDDNAGD